jgi:hypothetical protein
MAQNPTHNPDEFSKQLLQNKIRPGIETYLDTNFQDPESSRRGSSIPDEPGQWPPLVVTALPEGGRVERNDDDLEDDGLAEPTLEGNSGDWDPTSKTKTWQFTLEGLVHTHPDSDFTIS